MDWDALKTFAAVWGAALSTVLALARILPSWPIVFTGPALFRSSGNQALSISIRNAGNTPLLLSGLWRIAFPRRKMEIGIFRQRAEVSTERNTDEIMRHLRGSFNEYIGPGDFAIFNITGIEESTSGILGQLSP